MVNEKTRSWLPFGMSHIFYGWWIVFACFIIGLYTGGIIFYGFTALIDPLVREFGWSYTQISFAMSLRGIEMSFLSPLVGFLVDRYGPRRLAFWGVITIGLSFFMMSVTQSLWMFYASFVLIAFGGGGCEGGKSYLSFLDALLEEEVGCREQRRVESRPSMARIPKIR